MSVGNFSFNKESRGAVADMQVPTTQKEVRSFVQFRNVYAKLIHHFSDLAAALTCLLRKSQPQQITLTHACLEVFDTLKLRLISTP
jgi:hypothetical protein